jgi:hypothetical protein
MLYVGVKTWGAHADPSPVGEETFWLYYPLRLTITSPAVDGEAIESMPLVVSWAADDRSGVSPQEKYTVEIYNLSGDLQYATTQYSADTSISIPAEDFLPDNLGEFTLRLTVTNTAGLQTVAERIFVTEYLLPAIPDGDAIFNNEDGSATLSIAKGEDPDAPLETASLAVQRIYKGEKQWIATGLPVSASLVDQFPPVGREFIYRIFAFDEKGLYYNYRDISVLFSSSNAYFNFGDKYLEVAKSPYNVALSRNYGDTGEVLQFEGRSYPSLMSGTAHTIELSYSAALASFEAVDAFERLALYNQRAMFRSPDGFVAWVKAQVNITPYPYQNKRAEVAVTMQRIDDELA